MLSPLLISLLLFHHFYVVLAGEIFQGLHIRAMLLLHHKTYRRTGLSAPEALVYPFGRRNVKRRRLFIMEGAAGNEIGSAAPKRHIISHHISNLRRVQNLIYCLLRYHLL